MVVSYFLGAKIAQAIGNAGTTVVAGIVAIGLAVRAGWRVGAQHNPTTVTDDGSVVATSLSGDAAADFCEGA